MAIEKYSGLSQTQKYFARYGKSVGKDVVARQQKHLALETIKREAASKLQLPNLASQAQKTALKLPNLSGGIYESVADRLANQAISVSADPKALAKLKAQLAEAQASGNITRIGVLQRRLNMLESLSNPVAETTGLVTASKPNYSSAFQQAVNDLNNTGRQTAQTVSHDIQALPAPAKNPISVSNITAEGAKNLEKVKKTCNGNISVNIGSSRNEKLDKMAYYYKNLEKESAEAAKPKGLLGRLKAFASTKKGKIGLAAAAITALIAGGVYLYNRNKEDVTPVSDSSPANDLAKLPVNGQMSAGGPYTVAKGDNIWNIARAHLMEIHKDEKDYNPTDVEILKRTEEIMQLNDLHYEKDCYRVIIQPNQSLKLVA